MAVDLFLFAILLTISVVDLRIRRIPDTLSLPLIVAGLIVAGLGRGAVTGQDSAIGAALGYLVFAAIGAAFWHSRGQEGLGLGDAKLLSAAGAWLGWQALPAVVLIAATGGLVQAATAAVFGVRGAGPARSLAFGPWLAVGFFAMWLLGR